MPEALIYENPPGILRQYQIEPFREEYIPGSIVLNREQSNEFEVFFQIPKPIAQKMNPVDLDALKREIHIWWQANINSE
ncbi:hypothetical protein KKF04_05670 [Patescibacteria group bacterium]|nr:hypothetical protein [Patescibacteria group bacterium]